VLSRTVPFQWSAPGQQNQANNHLKFIVVIGTQDHVRWSFLRLTMEDVLKRCFGMVSSFRATGQPFHQRAAATIVSADNGCLPENREENKQ